MRNLSRGEWGAVAASTAALTFGGWLIFDESPTETISAAPRAAYEELIDEPAELTITTLGPVVVEPIVPVTNNKVAAGSAEMPCVAGEVISGVNTEEPILSVTIDDGLTLESTRQLLGVVEEHRAQGFNHNLSFFVLGKTLETPEGQTAAQEVLAANHQLAVHSLRHVLGEPDTNAAEHGQANSDFQQAVGFVPYGYRAVGLAYNDTLMQTVAGSGQCFIDVSIGADTKDWECDDQPDNAIVQNYMIGRVAGLGMKRGDFLLMHQEITETAENGGDYLPRPNSAFELDLILDRLESMGMRSETVTYALQHGAHINQLVIDESRHEC